MITKLYSSWTPIDQTSTDYGRASLMNRIEKMSTVGLPKRKPIPSVEPFRPLNEREYKTIIQCAKRNRIPPKDTHKALHELPRQQLYVSYLCTSYGLTQCLILTDGFILFQGLARLNPIDSYNKNKGEALAFYRAVTESEAILLPVSGGIWNI